MKRFDSDYQKVNGRRRSVQSNSRTIQNKFNPSTLLRLFTFNDIFTALLLAFIIAVIPTIVKIIFITPTPDEAAIRMFQSDGSVPDVVDAFTYYKSRALLICGTLLVLFYAACVFIGDVKINFNDLKDPVLIASASFVALAALSTFFSGHRQLALTGFSDRNENVYILAAYIVVFLSVKSFVKTGAHARLVLAFFLFSALFIGIIGAFQAFGRDIFQTAAGNRWALGNDLFDVYYPPGITVKFPDQVYSTLYNPNCVGLYASLLIPVFLLSSVFYFKNAALKLLSGVGGVLLVICAAGSKSTAGLFGLAAAAVVCIAVGTVYFFEFYKNKKLKRIVITILASLAVVTAAAAVVRRNELATLAARILNTDGSNQKFFVENLVVSGGSARFVTANGDFYIETGDEPAFAVLGPDKTVVEATNADTSESGMYTGYYDIPDVGLLALQAQGGDGAFSINGFWMYMRRGADGGFIILDTHRSEIDLSVDIPRLGFKNTERFGSSRGYIWSRALPLLSKYFALGSGPESFAVVFPQRDVIGKLRNFGDAYMLVDKAHNFYIQTGVTTGVFSLAALLFIFIRFIVTALKKLLCGEASDLRRFALLTGILAGVVGYLVCSLSTDSAVSTAPLFWAALGLGYGVMNNFENA